MPVEFLGRILYACPNMKPGGEYKEMGKAGAIALKTVVVLLMVVMLTACARVDDFMSAKYTAKYNIQIGNYRQNEYY